MNKYNRAFRAIDAVLSWNPDTIATSSQERMMRVDREIEKIQGYIDSRRAMLEAQSIDPRMLEIPISRDEALDYDGGDRADDRAENCDKYRVSVIAAMFVGILCSFTVGFLLTYMIFG